MQIIKRVFVNFSNFFPVFQLFQLQFVIAIEIVAIMRPFLPCLATANFISSRDIEIFTTRKLSFLPVTGVSNIFIIAGTLNSLDSLFFLGGGGWEYLDKPFKSCE